MTPRPFILTPRDLDILASLSQVRFLTIQHLQWLHWPQPWRKAEETARAAGVVTWGPKRTYARVAAMAERGLVKVYHRAPDRATTTFQRLPHAISLTRTGAALLAAWRGMEPDGLWFDERATRAAATLEHSLGIGAFYAALRAELEYRGRALHGWAADHVLCADYDSVAVASVSRPLPIIPDATFVLDERRFFLEIDRGTTRVEQWRKKALAYQAYPRDGRLHARYGVSTFDVLVVAPNAQRLLLIARIVAAARGGVADNYRFLVAERVNPLRIRRRWQRMERVEMGRPREAAHQLPLVTLRDDVLWTPRPEEQTR